MKPEESPPSPAPSIAWSMVKPKADRTSILKTVNLRIIKLESTIYLFSRDYHQTTEKGYVSSAWQQMHLSLPSNVCCFLKIQAEQETDPLGNPLASSKKSAIHTDELIRNKGRASQRSTQPSKSTQRLLSPALRWRGSREQRCRLGTGRQPDADRPPRQDSRS